MRHTLCFRTCGDGRVLLEEETIAYGLASRYERCTAELGIAAGQQVRVELWDDDGLLLDWRHYLVSEICGQAARSTSPVVSCPARTDDENVHLKHDLVLGASATPEAPSLGRVRCRYRWQ